MITVKLFANLRKNERKFFDVEYRDQLTIREVVSTNNICEEDVAIVLVNGRHHTLDYMLNDQDVVMLFPQIAGG